MSDEGLPQLVGSLYDVALAPGCWEAWLTQLCDAVQAEAAVLIASYAPNVGDRGRFAVGLPDLPAERDATNAQPASVSGDAPRYLLYLAEDARLFRKVLALEEGELVLVSEVLPEEQFVATRFYREWLRPRELHHVLSLIVRRTQGSISGLTLLRRPERGPFERAVLDLLQRLLPHLRRVVQIQERLVEAERRLEFAHGVLDALRCRAILVDDTGRVCGSNERAAMLLDRREGLWLERAELRAEDPQETSALRRLVRDATSAEGPSRSGVLALSRASKRHALVVSVSPLEPNGSRLPRLPGPKALVLLRDPEELPALHEPSLRKLYGLTAAEACVASRLAHGETLHEIGAALRVGRATVRTHLQRTFDKTGVHRQSELVRLLLMGGAALAEPGSLLPASSR